MSPHLIQSPPIDESSSVPSHHPSPSLIFDLTMPNDESSKNVIVDLTTSQPMPNDESTRNVIVDLTTSKQPILTKKPNAKLPRIVVLLKDEIPKTFLQSKLNFSYFESQSDEDDVEPILEASDESLDEGFKDDRGEGGLALKVKACVEEVLYQFNDLFESGKAFESQSQSEDDVEHGNNDIFFGGSSDDENDRQFEVVARFSPCNQDTFNLGDPESEKEDEDWDPVDAHSSETSEGSLVSNNEEEDTKMNNFVISTRNCYVEEDNERTDNPEAIVSKKNLKLKTIYKRYDSLPQINELTMKLRKYNDIYTCEANEENKVMQAKAPWAVNELEVFARANPTFAPVDLFNEIYCKYGVHISYWTAWRARIMLLEKMHGNYEEGYMVISEMKKQILERNKRSIVKWYKDSVNEFVGFFVAYKTSLDGFIVGNHKQSYDGNLISLSIDALQEMRIPRNLNVWKMGMVNYLDALKLQEKLVSDRKLGKIPDTILSLQHLPTYTLEKRRTDHNLLVPEADLRTMGAELHYTQRGGDITYHGPHQEILYLIISLKDKGLGARKYVENLESIMIEFASLYGVSALAGMNKCETGVWVGDRNIGAIGVQISSGITSHGMAFNIDPDLNYFKHIVPCGIADKEITSLKRETDMVLLAEEVIQEQLVSCFARSFGYDTLVQKENVAIALGKGESDENL
ncbi:hypothetical protein IFM89_023975 [Coptis chinensis]|uniref:lipoyl(octanoyl) transferase n=1 Tax=Coptis chinensis TaxID=261450 RepID=A0A835HN59_9MAGN|nr:hypothetical protein IFM89_023975 [Coptis chinensis]